MMSPCLSGCWADIASCKQVCKVHFKIPAIGFPSCSTLLMQPTAATATARNVWSARDPEPQAKSRLNIGTELIGYVQAVCTLHIVHSEHFTGFWRGQVGSRLRCHAPKPPFWCPRRVWNSFAKSHFHPPPPRHLFSMPKYAKWHFAVLHRPNGPDLTGDLLKRHF